MIPSAAWRYWRLDDTCCSVRGDDAAMKIASAFEWPGQPSKIAPFPWGYALPSNAWFLGPSRVFVQIGITICSAVYAQLTVECPITWQSVATFSPKVAPSPWDAVTPPKEDRATAIGNMHKTFGNDRIRGSGDMLADRQTHTHTQMCSVLLQRAKWIFHVLGFLDLVRYFTIMHFIKLLLLSLPVKVLNVARQLVKLRGKTRTRRLSCFHS